MLVSTYGNDGWNQPAAITGPDWNLLVDTLYADTTTVYGISGPANGYYTGPTIEALLAAIPAADFRNFNAGYIAAILVHEGVLHHHHGQLPKDSFKRNCPHPYEARIFLKPSPLAG